MAWGLEIESEALRVCRAELRRGRIRLRRRAEVVVPLGLIRPSLKDPNVADPAALRGLLSDLRRTAGCRGWVRVALPDPVFTLRCIASDELPARRQEARGFLCWQARHLLPFPPEEARLDFLPAGPGPDGRAQAICLMARDRVLREYEQVLEGTGLRAAALDARSISLAQAASPRLGRGTTGLLAVGGAGTTLLLVQEGQPRFWRILPDGRDAWANGDRARLIREVAASITFWKESEGVGPLDGLTLGGLGLLTTQVMAAFANWLEVPVSALDLGATPGPDQYRVDPAEDLDRWGPAIGAAIRPC